MHISRVTAVLALSAICCIAADPAPVKGPYTVSVKNYKYAAMDSTSHDIAVYYPRGARGQKFPLISYAHGDGGGGAVAQAGYAPLIKAMSAFGYIIALPKACNKGCRDDTSTLPHDPTGFAHYYLQQLKVFDFASEQMAAGDAVFATVNASVGVGIAGHSMGGAWRRLRSRSAIAAGNSCCRLPCQSILLFPITLSRHC